MNFTATEANFYCDARRFNSHLILHRASSIVGSIAAFQTFALLSYGKCTCGVNDKINSL